MSDSMVGHFDACLGCMACVTACPSGVQYDRLIEQTRDHVERHGGPERIGHKGPRPRGVGPGQVLVDAHPCQKGGDPGGPGFLDRIELPVRREPFEHLDVGRAHDTRGDFAEPRLAVAHRKDSLRFFLIAPNRTGERFVLQKRERVDRRLVDRRSLFLGLLQPHHRGVSAIDRP